MTDQQLATVREAFEALVAGLSSGDIGVLRRSPWSPDVEYAEDESWPGASEFKGSDSVAARFTEYAEIIGEVEAHLEDVRDAGDRAQVTMKFTGRAGASGLPMDHMWTYLVTERDGTVVRFEAYLDPPGTRP